MKDEPAKGRVSGPVVISVTGGIYRPGVAWEWNNGFKAMEEITLQIQRDEPSGWLVAWWDDPDGAGGITTQGHDLRDLQHQITEAVAVHFDEGAAPRRIRIHFVSDPILLQA